MPADEITVTRAILTNAGFARVLTDIPDPLPLPFIRLLTSDNRMLTAIQTTPAVTVEIWAANRTDARNLARKAWAALQATAQARIGNVWVYDTEVSPPVYYPDTASKTPRYTCTALLTIALEEVQL